MSEVWTDVAQTYIPPAITPDATPVTTTIQGTQWSYSGDPTTTPRDEVRFLLQDTDVTNPQLSDVEIDYCIQVGLKRADSLLWVAWYCCNVLIARYTAVVNASSDGVSVDTGTLVANYRALATTLWDQYQTVTADDIPVNLDNISWGDLPDPSITPLTFGLGLFDNLRAGNQQYGNVTGALNEFEYLETDTVVPTADI